MNRSTIFFAAFVVYSFLTVSIKASDVSSHQTISLAGNWHVKLDPNKVGVKQQWYANDFEQSIKLPGTLDQAQLGNKNDRKETQFLTRAFIFTGPAWYQYTVDIPRDWQNKHITLNLERAKHSQLWIDQTDCGQQESLVTPHVYETALTPGRHKITLCIDNSNLPPIGGCHQASDHTQTNWNGIIGDISLKATAPVWIKDIQVYPDISAKIATVKITLANSTGKEVAAKLSLTADSLTGKHKVHTSSKCSLTGQDQQVSCKLDMGSKALLWDEFSPNLYRLDVELDSGKYGKDNKAVDFGMRQFRTKGTQFTINDRPTFLRGKVDNCVFPLTGYPPMDKKGWLKVFAIAKSYGLNQYRFHSWCPPEAAFAAADELGFYIQAELPVWTFFGLSADPYYRTEGQRILTAYGSHPSFAMMTMGNELLVNDTNRQITVDLVNNLRSFDPRHLYAEGTCMKNTPWNHGPTDDFWVTRTTADMDGNMLYVRGSDDRNTDGHINNKSPSTMTDYKDAIADVSVPVIAHELGQFQTFPNFDEIPKYTGILKPRNFEIFRQRLADRHMLDQDRDFVRASGALSVICYREDIETTLRTRNFGGFEMLDLQDFPGQGVALVGILDAFMDSKGLITPAQWSQFCSAVVPLVRMPKYTWTTQETFTAKLQVSNYGPKTIDNGVINWTLRDSSGKVLLSSSTSPKSLLEGTVTDIADINISLANIKPAQKLMLEVSIKGTSFTNSYPLWVYPSTIDTAAPKSVTLVRKLDSQTLAALNNGAAVLLLPPLQDVNGIRGTFITDFWSFPMFKRVFKGYTPPGTMGILCDPNHPIFKNFPTEFHSNWQWWHLVKNAGSVILDSTPADYRPIVQSIDNFDRNHKLGLIFETRVGKGRLLICTIDLPALQDHPEARQMLHCLLNYAASGNFNPKQELTYNTFEPSMKLSE